MLVSTRSSEADADDDEDRAGQAPEGSASEHPDRFRHARNGAAVGELQGDALADAERRQRDDERMRQPAEDVEEPVHRADERAGCDHRQDDRGRRTARLKQQRADDGREREVRSDGKVDTARQDDEMLAHRHDGDDRRLRQDVAHVARREEDRRQEAENDDQSDQDKRRADAEQLQSDVETGIRSRPTLRDGTVRRHAYSSAFSGVGQIRSPAETRSVSAPRQASELCFVSIKNNGECDLRQVVFYA